MFSTRICATYYTYMVLKSIKEKVIYLDNAATTALDPRVAEAMAPYLREAYGNPSMTYRLGNISKVAIEQARRMITALLHGEEGNIWFTSGGTEANNWAIKGIVEANKITHIITSPIEHMSVRQPIAYLAKKGIVQVHYLPLDAAGHIVYTRLEELLRQYPNALVSLMHGNNEIGNITDIYRVGAYCKAAGALFHSDMVQTLGILPIQLKDCPVDIVVGSAHKFHGPKGVGFIYVRHGIPIAPLLHGGAQEQGSRAGTENVAYIVGMAKALSLAVAERAEHIVHIQKLKQACITGLVRAVPGIIFHGACRSLAESLPHILNVAFPWEKYRDTLLLQLDIAHIYASAGSACMSGTQKHSHVLEALGVPHTYPVMRISFGKYNTLAEVQQLTKKIAAY